MFSAGCGVVALTPFPLQYQGNVTAENQRAFWRDRRKLMRYWARLGFQRVGKELMILNPVLEQPTLEEVLGTTRTQLP
mgnify:CR=1 FL=1|jgi:hypothetical protein